MQGGGGQRNQGFAIRRALWRGSMGSRIGKERAAGGRDLVGDSAALPGVRLEFLGVKLRRMESGGIGTPDPALNSRP